MAMDLKKLAKKTTGSPKKSKQDQIVIDSEPIADKIKRYKEAAAAVKNNQAIKDELEEDIIDYIEPKWLKGCRDKGEPLNSCTCDTLRVTFKGKSQFLTSASIKEEELKKVFGKKYSGYFQDKDGPMKLTKEAVENEEVSAALTEAISGVIEKFPDVQIIEYDTKVIVMDTLFNDFVMATPAKRKELLSKLSEAGAKRTKTTIVAK